MRRWILPVVGLPVVLLLCPDGWAGSPTEQLRGFFASATRILDDPGTERNPEARLSAIRTIVGDIFDFREAAQLSLGPEWNARTPAERAEFVLLFADLLEHSFIAGIASRIRLADGLKVSYLEESVDGALATVRTAIVSKSGFELPFSYRMIDRGDRWAVRDVVIDGVSLAANYRAQFVRVMQTSSYGELVQQIRARVPRTPAAPPVATAAVTDGRAIAPATPAPAPTEVSRKESPEPTSWPAFPEMSPDFTGHDLPMGGPSAPGQQPNAVQIVMAHLEPTAIGPKSVAKAKDGSAREDRRIQPDQLQVVTATRPVSAHASNAGAYWIQVGAFSNPEAARRLASLLRRQEPPVSSNRWVIVEAVPPGTPLTRVRVGPFSGRAEAASKLRELQTRGFKSFIAEERD